MTDPAGETSSESVPHSGPALASGAQLGPYTIVAWLGAGGMGEVYKAHDTRLDRTVALKVLAQELINDPEARQRFEREARAVAALSHPRICTLHDIGRHDGIDFLVMEYVEGETLAARLTRRRLQLVDAISYGCQIADALTEAHEHGIVHRDLKPANIMLTKGGAKLLDFGLAKLLPFGGEQPAAPTQLSYSDRGMMIGTAAYMSPEQARGQPVDARTDVWSLGCVLYEMVAGKSPFASASVSDVLVGILKNEPEPLTRIDSTVPLEYERIATKALRKEQSDRYQTVRDLLVDLRALRDGPGTADVTSGRHSRNREVRRRWWPAAATAAAGVVIAALLLSNVGGLRERSLGGSNAGRIQALAVLPLRNLSGDPEQEYFTDGMTDELITALGHFGGLKVISRTSVMHYKDSAKTMPEIARELKVDAVLQGSVLRSGDRARITVQLTDGASDRNLWGESYERDLRDVLTLQDEVARAIASEIEVRLTPQQRTARTSRKAVDPRANENYLRGRYYWNKWTAEGYVKAGEYFQRAIEDDPTYAAAHAGVADANAALGYYGVLSPAEAFPRAKASALKALELDETLSDAHTSLALVADYFEWDWARGEQEFTRALQLNPSSAMAHLWYSYHLVWRGKFDSALVEARRAQELDPLSLVTSTSVANILHNARRYEEAVEQCRKVLELDPGFHWAHHSLGEDYIEMGKFKEGVAELTLGVDPGRRNPHFRAKLAYGLARAGDRRGAVKILDELERESRTRYIPPTQIAAVHAALGNTQGAFDWLDKAYRVRDSWIPQITVEPPFRPLHSDPRLGTLLRRVGLQLGQ